MAIDSIQKRESAFGILLPFTRVGPTADGSDANSTDERAHLVMNYNGIAASSPAGGRIWNLIGLSGLIGEGGGLIT